MTYWVLAYDRPLGVLVARHEFAESERDRAWEERLRLMIAYRADPDVEVVMLGAESEVDVRATHGRYFYPPPERREHAAK